MKKENKSQESIYNNKGGSVLSHILRFILPYSIYTKLPLSLKDDSATFDIDKLNDIEKLKIMTTIKKIAEDFGDKLIIIGTKTVIIDLIERDINKLVETKTSKKLSLESKLKIIDEIELYINSKKQLLTESDDYTKIIKLINKLKDRIKNGK